MLETQKRFNENRPQATWKLVSEYGSTHWWCSQYRKLIPTDKTSTTSSGTVKICLDRSVIKVNKKTATWLKYKTGFRTRMSLLCFKIKKETRIKEKGTTTSPSRTKVGILYGLHRQWVGPYSDTSFACGLFSINLIWVSSVCVRLCLTA